MDGICANCDECGFSSSCNDRPGTANGLIKGKPTLLTRDPSPKDMGVVEAVIRILLRPGFLSSDAPALNGDHNGSACTPYDPTPKYRQNVPASHHPEGDAP